MFDDRICGRRRGALACADARRLASDLARPLGAVLGGPVTRAWYASFARNSWMCGRTTQMRCRFEHAGRGDDEVTPDHGFEILNHAIDLAGTLDGGRCILRDTGVVDCGDLGVDYQRIPGVDHAIALGNGPDDSLCALGADGTVTCWNEYLRRAGTPPRALPGLHDAVELATGRDHACVRRRSGAVACWGRWEMLGAGRVSMTVAPVVAKIAL